jgi:hypothetical protein
MSLGSWFSSHKAVIVHSVSVASMLAGSLAKATGNPALIAGISVATAAFHIGEGLKTGGSTGLSSAATALGDVTNTLKEMASSVSTGAAKPA